MKHHITLWLTVILCSVSMNSYSFDLFNPDRGKPPEKAAPPPRPNPFAAQKMQPKKPKPPPPKPQLLPQKDFMLRGTSRLGEQWSAVLQAPNGKQFIQRIDPDQRTAIEGYPEYYLLQVDAREVQLQYPSNSPCRNSNAQKGILCSADQKTATLSLVHRQAIRKPRKVNSAAKRKNQQQGKLSAAEARKKREEARQKRRELYKNFKRRVIKDEDVPPGMRVVRTPFGDRLVPDNK